MRSAGILLHPTSLPGPGPCGTFGRSARHFAALLAEAGCSLWQVLPLHPPSAEGSPYDSPSAFAIDPRLIDLPDLVEAGLLSPLELGPIHTAQSNVAVELIEEWHQPRLVQAAKRLASTAAHQLETFTSDHPWVLDWARFAALRKLHGGRGWWTWPEAHQSREDCTLTDIDHELAEDISREVAIQFIASEQWKRLRAHAHSVGIRFIGDVPIFVCRDGADTWANPELFRLNTSGRPDPTTGVPPDAFSDMGQWWNNPHYAWSVHEESNFQWWISRLKTAMDRHDTIRIDHFRGLCGAWAIPASAKGDARQGTWETAPGAALLTAALETLPQLNAIAEDLGIITPDVTALRNRLGWPGMKVLQFGFTPEGHIHLPPYDTDLCVAYSGTHDNNTTRGWYAESASTIRAAVDEWANAGSPCPDPAKALIRGAWMSNAQWAVAPLQDLLGLGAEARMNRPGTREGNWSWRSPTLNETSFAWLAALNQESCRFAPATEAL